MLIASDVPIPAPRMQPQDRRDWIIAYMMAHSYMSHKNGSPIATFSSTYVDCINADFIDAYCDATGVEPSTWMILGSNKCATAVRDLKALHDQGLLHRHRTGIDAPASGGGWPKWVWSYSVDAKAETLCRNIADQFKVKFPTVRVY
jgi:hypothetical protein